MLKSFSRYNPSFFATLVMCLVRFVLAFNILAYNTNSTFRHFR